MSKAPIRITFKVNDWDFRWHIDAFMFKLWRILK